MKRTLSIILAILSFTMILTGCGGGSEPTETREPAVPTNVANPMTFEEFNSLPIANENMTEDERRALVINYMRYQNSFAWTPSEKLSYHNKDYFVMLAPGTVYGGCPYRTQTKGSIYNILNYYDDRNGMVDTAKMSSMKQDWIVVICNVCSTSPYWAWGRVSNSVKGSYTYTFIPYNNYITVGPYYMDPAINDTDNGLKKIGSDNICKENGEQIMYQSYAAMKPADGLVWVYNDGSGGHAIMNSSIPNVVKNDDGTINGRRSTITFLDQALWFTSYPQENGITKKTFGNVDETYTFEKLYNLGALPFTIPELVGTEPIEKGEASVTYQEESVTVDMLTKMDVKTNYPISYNQIVIKDKKGKELYKNWTYSANFNIYTLRAVTSAALDLDELKALAGNGNTVEISTRISTGEVITVYSGKLSE